jgi:hypothetical protein
MGRSVKQPPMRNGSVDDYQTPPEALAPLLPFLKRNWTIWECACGSKNLVRELQRKGYKVCASDKERDFLLAMDSEQFDCIITNPPYSLKDQFLAKCYELGKPFALLLPLTAWEGKKRQGQFKQHGIQLVLFNRRINFETPSGNGNGSWFATAWFTWGLNLPNELTFVDYEAGKVNRWQG